MNLWQHLVPAFDTWWPNEYAAFWWGLPAAGLALWRSVKAHRSRMLLHAKLDALHEHLGIGQEGET